MRKAMIGLVALAASALLAVPSLAAAAPTVSVTYSFTHNKLKAPTSIAFNMKIANADGSTPTPVKQIVAHLPAGLVVNYKGIPTCTSATLSAKGAAGCPGKSLIAKGQAVVQANLGGTLINENASEQWFIAPPQGGQLTGNILGVGTTPIAETLVIPTVLARDSKPYGYKLVATIPDIPTVPGGPNASIVSVQLTTGWTGRVKVMKKVHGKRRKVTVTQSLITSPKSCPKGGFKWGATNTYADGSTTSTTVTTRCP